MCGVCAAYVCAFGDPSSPNNDIYMYVCFTTSLQGFPRLSPFCPMIYINYSLISIFLQGLFG